VKTLKVLNVCIVGWWYWQNWKFVGCKFRSTATNSLKLNLRKSQHFGKGSKSVSLLNGGGIRQTMQVR